MAPTRLPELPAPHAGVVDYIADNPGRAMSEILTPFREYEAGLRTMFAQEREDPRLDDPYINVLPLFTDKTDRITTRARDLASESQAEKDRYIMALPDNKRRPHGSPATVGSLKDFRKNFGIFSENSLADLDWSNVVAAGSSVVNCLLPVPEEYNTTKRKLREYYHQKFCPASDVDLFLYGLNEEQAIEKIKQIEQAVRDAILSEVTVIRTKNAITIASQYPTRHVQIVLRCYKSISEILTGFDIDAACAVFDGNQVYVTPRALGSFITQVNQVDLSRRSPSYENRLSKYSHRNFEIYWPELNRDMVDPTIFERSFRRTLGLARLLVLERLPSASAREQYLNRRREERGRPAVHNSRELLPGNIKDQHDDEIADWVDEAEVSNYHTFTVPYGERFHAKRIEKLCYTRDLLLNAEWNQQKREVYLHRHPTFFGRVEDVIKDCCGYCPAPVTDEEKEVYEKEKEIYISGEMKLMVQDPGSQQIGSFKPLTEDDWTDMAYVGNTARLCQSIVDADVDEVLAWLSQPDADANRRDYTGRTPLQLAVMCSTPEVVKCFVDHGARLTARMADGKTALHLAAERGIPDIIKLLMEKSLANEELEDEKDHKRKLMRGPQKAKSLSGNEDEEMTQDGDEDRGEDSDIEMVNEEEASDDGVHSFATGSFVKVKSEEKDSTKELEEVDESEPDFYKIDALAWDVPSSPLHLAIACGHEDVVKALCDYGGDSLLPVKFLNSEREPSGAILSLTLAAKLPLETAKAMMKLLFSLGATSAQADMDGWTALHRYVQSAHPELVDVLLEHDKMGAKVAINHLTFARGVWAFPSSPLHTAFTRGNPGLVFNLINAGAMLDPDFETWLKAAKASESSQRTLGTLQENKTAYYSNMLHPLLAALEHSTNTDLAIALVERGADPNSMTGSTYNALRNDFYRSFIKGETVLDIVRNTRAHLQRSGRVPSVKPALTPGLDECLARYKQDTYQHWVISRDVARIKESHRERMDEFEKSRCGGRTRNAKFAAQRAAVKDKISGLQKLEELLVSKGAKTFAELHPKIVKKNRDVYRKEKRTREEEEPYEYNFHINHVSDLTDARQEAYIQLLEAAFSGDLEKIKSLTLHAWGEDGAEPPLKIAVRDYDDNSPFSLAFFKGHFHVAWGVLEIAQAQYSPPDEEKKLYQLRMGGDSDDDPDSECLSDSHGNHEPRVVSKTLDEKFTIDNVGEVSLMVQSRVTAIDFLQWRCNTFEISADGVPSFNTRRLWEFFTDGGDKDMRAFATFVEMSLHFGSLKDAAGIDQNSAAPYEYEFREIVEGGKVKILKEAMRMGAGLPLDDLVKKSGVEVKAKPRYYPGLSVYGKKRNDWATAGRNMYVKLTGLKTPPLLHAAKNGRREMVEWLLSDEPLRLYTEFSQSKAAQNDSRLKLLRAVPGRFEQVVSKWLGYQRERVLHSVIIATESEEAIGLLKHLIKTYPMFLEVKITGNNTPLLTAARLGRMAFMKLLIAASADQSARNKSGENVVHLITLHVTDPKQYKVALDLLDADLRSHLFTQRTSLASGGLTALHRLVDNFKDHDSPDAEKYEELIKLHLGYSKGVELEMLNSAGDSALHTAVMGESPWLTRLLVGFCPKLLYLENAVGRTPIELAYHKYISKVFTPPNNGNSRGHTDPSEWLDTVRKEAVPSSPNMYAASVDEVWDLCRAEMERHPHKRRLVSLHEANDVAKRLGEQYTSSRYFSGGPHYDDEKSNEADSNQERDLIDEWTQYGVTEWHQHKTDEAEKREEVCGECGHRHSAEDEDDIDSDFFSDGSDVEDQSDDDIEDGSDNDGDSGDGDESGGSDYDDGDGGSDMDEDSD